MSVNRIRYKALAGMICMLCASSALAASYSISPDYEGPPGSMCRVVRDALAGGLVRDAERTLCERRFELSHRAERLGLLSIDKTLVPSSDYAGLLREMLPIIGQEHRPQSDADRKHDEVIISKMMKNGNIKIYTAHFDEDNSGKSRLVYILDNMMCDIKDSSSETNPTIFVKNGDGTWDMAWGPGNATGNPFILSGKTYYARWQSMRGSVLKDALAQLDIYESVPFDPAHSTYASFPPSYCVIYQKK